MMSRKDFKSLASYIRLNTSYSLNINVRKRQMFFDVLLPFLREQNPKFNEIKFAEALSLEK